MCNYVSKYVIASQEIVVKCGMIIFIVTGKISRGF